MTNMKEWVDSAAGIAVPENVGDSLPPVSVTTFEEGSVAPATASDLPSIALVGFVFLIFGVGLVVKRSRG